MKTVLAAAARHLPSLLNRTTLAVTLSGWPAVTAIGLVCGTTIALTAIAATHRPAQAKQPA